MNNNTRKKIEDAVKEVVNSMSGGVKFTELGVEVISRGLLDKSEVDCDEFEKVIREMKDVKVLDYTWKEINRSKMFIYTP